MDPNRSKCDMARYQPVRGKNNQSGRGNWEQKEMSGCYQGKEDCGCGSSFEKIDQYPIAMAYVPWQKFGSVYELEKAFCVGTIFPELDQPFMRARCGGR